MFFVKDRISHNPSSKQIDLLSTDSIQSHLNVCCLNKLLLCGGSALITAGQKAKKQTLVLCRSQWLILLDHNIKDLLQIKYLHCTSECCWKLFEKVLRLLIVQTRHENVTLIHSFYQAIPHTHIQHIIKYKYNEM